MNTPVTKTQRGAVAWISLNRPEAGNAIGPVQMEALGQALGAAAHAPETRCIVLTGAGTHFCVGGDVRFMAEQVHAPAAQRDQNMDALVAAFAELVVQMQATEKPIIAVVRGAVAGGGLSLMCACDLVIASETTFCKFAYSQLGATPDGGGTYSLARLLGLRKALELALLDERIDAQRALALGLVNQVVPDAALEAKAQALAERLAQQATAAMGRTKRLLHAAFDQTMAQQAEDERVTFMENVAGHDFSEGVKAFVEKRPAQFKGG